MGMAVAHTRRKILDAAEALFFGDGIAVTGVDRVAETAGVSVVTLYKHMGSKEGLLSAVLKRRLEEWDRVWEECVRSTDDPRAKVLAVFDAVAAFRAQAGATKWCTFLATASERSADDSAAALVAADRDLLVQRLTRLARAADPDRAPVIVDTTALLYNGVLASLLREAPDEAVDVARDTACLAFGWTDLARCTQVSGRTEVSADV
jgi:AcrR family transcriptional regulator